MSKSNKKYLCIAGYVYSKTDGDRHFIPAHRLADLYGVDRRQCIYAQDGSEKLLRSDVQNLIVLRPRGDGDYRLPEAR